MTHHRISLLTLIGIGLALALPVVAQEVEQDPNEAARAEVEAQGFRLPPQFRQIEYRDANPWVLHTNVRVGSADSTITFGGSIGNIAPNNDLADIGADPTSRLYDDGRVLLDEVREHESTSTVVDGRYQTFDSNGDLNGDFLAYDENQSREWAFGNVSQYDNGYINMNQFSTASEGVTYTQDAESSGVGFEMSVSRRVMKIGRKMELGISGSLGFSDFNGSTRNNMTADLITLTDRYEYLGTEVPTENASYSSFGTLSDPEIGIIISGGRYETTIPIAQNPTDRTVVTTPGGANVAGRWTLDGAYYSIRVGPELRGHLTEKIAFTAGAGLLGAFVGTDFNVVELLELEDYGLFQPVRFTANDRLSEMIFGYYAEVTAEYWITQRTGFFIGGLMESIDDFVHSVGGRTASVSVGEAYVFRVGIIHRF